MARKKQPSREELLAQLEELDNSTEVARLTAEVTRLTEENRNLLESRRSHERALARYEKGVASIRDAITVMEGMSRQSSRHNLGAVAARTARSGQAEVAVGVTRGTHDPATGLPYTEETVPPRNLAVPGASPVRKRELERIFPELNDSPEALPEEADASS